MPTITSAGTANIFPVLGYADAPAAIAWLGRAFGFEEHMVARGEDGTIHHAELRLGPGMVMLSSNTNSAWQQQFRIRSPRELGAVTQSVYICIEEVDAHFAGAVTAGAEIVRRPKDMPYGSREYSVRDPEGNLWHFGTYRPNAA